MSEVFTEIGGGLRIALAVKNKDGAARGNVRPGSVNANDPSGLKTIWIDVLDIGDIPPNILCASSDKVSSAKQKKKREYHERKKRWETT